MVHKNYKWNISKEKGQKIVFDMIEEILKEQKNNSIEISELIFLLNHRTRHVNITNYKKKKNIINFVKINFGGIQQFIDNYDYFLLMHKNNKIIIKLNTINYSIDNFNDWVFVNDYEIKL